MSIDGGSPQAAATGADAPGATRTPRQNRRPRISFVIKAYNEEAKIAACLESVLAVAGEVEGGWEIVLADAVSADRTVEIARRYPVKVVQFARAEERGCGAGVQLGYQHAAGEFVYLLDGDMQMCPGFLVAAMQRLEQSPRLAGVAGQLVDTAVRNTFDRARANRASDSQTRAVRWLGGGGLYRRRAIEECGGYAADRNLKGWEEADLGLRLAAGGWTVERLDIPAVLHTGHDAGTWDVLRALWRSRRAMAGGVLLRRSFAQPWFGAVLRMLVHPLLVILGWFLAAVAGLRWVLTGSATWLAGLALLTGAVVALLAVRKRSLSQALTSIALWHFHAAALPLGLRVPLVPATDPIDGVVLAPAKAGE